MFIIIISSSSILWHACWLLLAFVLCLSIISIVHYTNRKIVLKVLLTFNTKNLQIIYMPS